MSYNISTSTQANYQAGVQDADQWRDFIAGGRSKTARPCANNTMARLISGGVAIKLHDTDIVTVYDNGTMRLDSGGWLTVTTKERINRYTNAGISQRNGIWYMRDGSLFYDGMLIRPDGTPLKPRNTDKYERQLKAIKKQAKEYAKGYVQALKDGLIDYPNGGDCWYCLMFEKQTPNASGAGHIRQHIKDKYYVPSLLVNAGRDAGYQDHQIGLMGIGGQRLFIEPERVIYRYVVKRLQREL